MSECLRVEWLLCPGSAIALNGIDDCQELSRGRGDGDELWRSSHNQLVARRFKVWVVLRGAHEDSGLTLVRPLPMKILPRLRPDCRVQGVSRTKAAIWPRPSRPSSGCSEIRVRALVLPITGTEASRYTFSRQARVVRTGVSVSRSMLASSLLPGADEAVMLCLARLGARRERCLSAKIIATICRLQAVISANAVFARPAARGHRDQVRP